MMKPPRAFDDEQLNADFAIILELRDGAQTPTIEHRRDRRRDAVTKVLRSPQASATIGAAFVIAMLGTTAFLLLPSHAERPIEAAPAAAPQVLAGRGAIGDPVPATAIVDAEPADPAAIAPRSSRSDTGARIGSKRVSFRSRSKPHTRQADSSVAFAAADGTAIDPVALEDRWKPDIERVTDLAQNAAPPPLPRVSPAALQASDLSSAPDKAGTDVRLARARRESVAALRALRRQW